MKRSRSSLFILCIVGIFLTVYGAAVILRLIFGGLLLDGGLTNPNYSLLALLCVVPFLFYLLVSRNDVKKINEVILTSGLFFILLFLYTNFILVLALTENSTEIANRLLIIFPIVALLLVIVIHFFQSKNSRWKEMK
ncbi:hypothetical protein [Sporosarcina sp. E16_8]|uniref:hypothetical protein n=1 Tax=Sporosarcina sp. E16_8 TaxID=2789295 RepID=UPI001A938C7D|nr:hypothetical protein [Sporosarcina sp. E16_8]MBO0586430.1 hypothetical protein [Sporosarcina sp. E16_8]